MDDLWTQVEKAFWSLLGRLADYGRDLIVAAWHNTLLALAKLAVWLDAVTAGLGRLPLWLLAALVVLPATGLILFMVRQRLYDRVLVYGLLWLRRQGFARLRLHVRRGAVRQMFQAMARCVPLPARFGGLGIYEVYPARYAVAYDLAGNVAREVRVYRRDTRAGLEAMGRDVAAYFRASRRLLHADGELRALFVLLDAYDPDFAACRSRLPGEPAAPSSDPALGRTRPGVVSLKNLSPFVYDNTVH